METPLAALGAPTGVAYSNVIGGHWGGKHLIGCRKRPVKTPLGRIAVNAETFTTVAYPRGAPVSKDLTARGPCTCIRF